MKSWKIEQTNLGLQNTKILSKEMIKSGNLAAILEITLNDLESEIFNTKHIVNK